MRSQKELDTIEQLALSYLFSVIVVILIKTLRFLRGWREKDTNPGARLTNGRGAGRHRIWRTRRV